MLYSQKKLFAIITVSLLAIQYNISKPIWWNFSFLECSESRDIDAEICDTTSHVSEEYYKNQLSRAYRTKNTKNAKRLIKNNTLKSKDHTLYFCKNNNKKLLKFLIDNGAPIDELCAPYACQANNIELLQFLINHKAPINKNCTLDACKTGNIETLKLLIAHKAPIHKNCTLYACKTGSTEILTLLVKNRAPTHEHCVHYASKQNNIASVKLLIEKKVNLNTTERENRNSKNKSLTIIDVTPLYVAAENGSLEAAKILLENGAYVNKKIEYYKNDSPDELRGQTTPLEIAFKKKKHKIAELLLGYGANISVELYSCSEKKQENLFIKHCRPIYIPKEHPIKQVKNIINSVIKNKDISKIEKEIIPHLRNKKIPTYAKIIIADLVLKKVSQIQDPYTLDPHVLMPIAGGIFFRKITRPSPQKQKLFIIMQDFFKTIQPKPLVSYLLKAKHLQHARKFLLKSNIFNKDLTWSPCDNEKRKGTFDPHEESTKKSVKKNLGYLSSFFWSNRCTDRYLKPTSNKTNKTDRAPNAKKIKKKRNNP